jgi:hypothetical protein
MLRRIYGLGMKKGLYYREKKKQKVKIMLEKKTQSW